MPDKKNPYSSLNIEDITDVNYKHAKKISKDFNTINLGDYHKLYIRNDPLLLAGVFENFRINVLKYMNLILLFFYL